MPSLTRTPRAARKQPDDDRRVEFERRVLRAVEELLSDGTPFTEIAVHRIAAASHSARSTFYRYFPDKSQLLIRLAELATADLFAAAEHWWSAEHTDERAGVVRAIRAMIDGFREHQHLLLALSEVAAYDRDVGRYWRDRVALFAKMVRERLVAERAAGRVSNEVDPTTTAFVLIAMVEKSIREYTRVPGITDELLAETLGRAIWLTVYGDADGG
ncbi:TetR/AcrR family transcriptional regulator [Nocardia transvalensis]|uniref:TetR/AcrR family transcriptional regulator n=1 Tax=Nocardia transvalensis TaxID=37333 RepID=UPI001895B867|nr:TetR/AcrR family transcriptional regulator [Nocardia transvalensis]MBF6330701.1 TetR/AcrR family transcriptional regulator [Nocardia transvalensis]